MEMITSADGTTIAFDQLGSGPPLVLVSGAMCGRLADQAIAEALADQFTVLNYDRRGRGTAGTPDRTRSPGRSRISRPCWTRRVGRRWWSVSRPAAPWCCSRPLQGCRSGPRWRGRCRTGRTTRGGERRPTTADGPTSSWPRIGAVRRWSCSCAPSAYRSQPSPACSSHRSGPPARGSPRPWPTTRPCWVMAAYRSIGCRGSPARPRCSRAGPDRPCSPLPPRRRSRRCRPGRIGCSRVRSTTSTRPCWRRRSRSSSGQTS